VVCDVELFGPGADFVGGGGFCFVQPVQLADCAAVDAAGRLTVRYFLILSSRFSPNPRMASRSFTLLNAPYDLRGGRRTDSWDGLQLRSVGSVYVYRLRERLFLSKAGGETEKAKK
jgi:hypothetical protein